MNLELLARRENELVVASLFVNPAQFGAEEDLDRYPRDEERDSLLVPLDFGAAAAGLGAATAVNGVASKSVTGVFAGSITIGASANRPMNS